MAKTQTKTDKSRQLSVVQENAIDLLVLGQRDEAVAEAVGVTRQTVCEWRNHDPLFSVELNRRRAAAWQGYSDRLRALLGKALDVLEEDLTEKPDDDAGHRRRQAAAIHVLKAAGLYAAGAIPSGPMSVAEAEIIKAEQERDHELRLLVTAGRSMGDWPYDG